MSICANLFPSPSFLSNIVQLGLESHFDSYFPESFLMEICYLYGQFSASHFLQLEWQEVSSICLMRNKCSCLLDGASMHVCPRACVSTGIYEDGMGKGHGKRLRILITLLWFPNWSIHICSWEWPSWITKYDFVIEKGDGRQSHKKDQKQSCG